MPAPAQKTMNDYVRRTSILDTDDIAGKRGTAVGAESVWYFSVLKAAIVSALPGGSSTWGQITGTLGNQTDLAAALALKATITALNAVAAAMQGLTTFAATAPTTGLYAGRKWVQTTTGIEWTWNATAVAWVEYGPSVPQGLVALWPRATIGSIPVGWVTTAEADIGGMAVITKS